MIQRFDSGASNVKPDIFIFTVFIKCCANVNGNDEEKKVALKMAHDAMEALDNLGYGPPNDVAFSTLMNAINELSNDQSEKKRQLETLFRRCAETGNVSKQVVSAMSLGTWKHIGHQDLKLAWSKNVPPRNKPK